MSLTVTAALPAGITDLPLAALRESDQGNYRPVDLGHVATLAEQFDRFGFQLGLGCPVVRESGQGWWWIVSGHHRILAARRLGWATIPCQVVELDDTDALAAQIRENVCRRDAPATADAVAFGRLRDQGWSVERIAEYVGRTVDYVGRRLDLADLDRDVRWIADRHGITWALSLAGLPGAVQRELARRLETDGPSRGRWDAICDEARRKVAEQPPAGLFELVTEEWASALGIYVAETVPESARAALPVPLGLVEIAGRVGVQVNTAHQWRKRGTLPAPDFTISGQPGWWSDTIDQWVVETGRRSGVDAPART